MVGGETLYVTLTMGILGHISQISNGRKSLQKKIIVKHTRYISRDFTLIVQNIYVQILTLFICET